MLNSLLSLQPLDLVEVSSKAVIREALAFSRQGPNRALETPYWFFQRIHESGALVVASPSGSVQCIEATDISHIIKQEPIRTMAMPAAQLRKKLGTTFSSADLFAAASVVSAMRDRWGRFEYRVWFDDPGLNESHTFFAPLASGERNRLMPLTRRTRMPVAFGRGAASWSADAESRKIVSRHQKKAAEFIAAALGGNRRTVARLAALDA